MMAGQSELNGNVIKSGSMEDLSEYTDADESISAPTEVLAEFLSAVMLKDYETALKYCKLILQYEPNHKTAKEFYPLILEKIVLMSAESQSSSSESEPNGSESSESEDADESSESDVDDDKPSDSDADTTASYSSLEDEEADNHTTVTTTAGCGDDNAAFLDPENGNVSNSESPAESVSPAGKLGATKVITAKLYI